MVSKKINYGEVMELININIDRGTQTKIPGIFEQIKDEDKRKFQEQLVNNILNTIDERAQMSSQIYQSIFYLQKLTRKLTVWTNRDDKKIMRRANKIIELAQRQNKFRKVI